MSNVRLQSTLEYDFQEDRVIGAVDQYRSDFVDQMGELAARTMADGMPSVGRSGQASRPGRFPHSRTGDLKSRIRWARDGEDAVVGPEESPVPQGYSFANASTVAEALNTGAHVTRRHRRRSRRTGRFIRSRTFRYYLRPRPFVQLTLEIIGRRMADIAQQTPLK